MLWIGIVCSKQLFVEFCLEDSSFGGVSPNLEMFEPMNVRQLQICTVVLIWEHLTAVFLLMFRRNLCNLL